MVFRRNVFFLAIEVNTAKKTVPLSKQIAVFQLRSVQTWMTVVQVMVLCFRLVFFERIRKQRHATTQSSSGCRSMDRLTIVPVGTVRNSISSIKRILGLIPGVSATVHAPSSNFVYEATTAFFLFVRYILLRFAGEI